MSYFLFFTSHCIFIALSSEASEASFLFCSRFITINPVTDVCRSLLLLLLLLLVLVLHSMVVSCGGNE